MGLWRNNKRGFFIPKYDELSLFMMSVAFLLVFFTNSQLRSGLFKLLGEPKDRGGIILCLLLFTAGLVLSLYHVFTEREKNIAEKFVMLFFAILTNAISGIFASAYVLSKSADAPCIFILLPLWNIMNCIILLVLFRMGVINPDNISDEDVRPFETLLGFIIILAIFAVCQFAFKLYWAITFSICVIYATSFSDALASMFHRGGQGATAENVAVAAEGESAKGAERCRLCGRLITAGETPWVIDKKLIVCKDCYDSIQKTK
jgi:hypothetical protein